MSVIPLSSSASTNDGNQRDHNEDTFLCAPDIGLWLVADGMGGHESGEVASEIARNYLDDAIRAGQPLNVAIKKAHHEILNSAKKGIGSEGMGTTIVALQVKDESYELAWVGDSRAYLWSQQDGSIRQISRDHSYVQTLVDKGLVSEAEAQEHPQANIITQALGYADLEDVAVDRIEGVFCKDEKILLCSDGLSNDVSPEQMQQIMAQGPTEQAIADNLIDLALKQGGSDNITAVVISAPSNAPKVNALNKLGLSHGANKLKMPSANAILSYIQQNQQVKFILAGAILATILLVGINYLIF